MNVSPLMFGLGEANVRTIALPYGHTSLDLHIEEEHLEALVETEMAELEPDPSEEELIRQAMAIALKVASPPAPLQLERGGLSLGI